MRKYIKHYIIIVMIMLLTIHCRSPYDARTLSILESSPYIGYDTYVLPEPIDSSHHLSLGLTGNYVNTSTDTDTTVMTNAGSITIHRAVSDFFEIGLAVTGTYCDDKFYGYYVLDFKFNLARLPVIASPNIGFGMGKGRETHSYDMRAALILGYEFVPKYLVFYIAPRYINYLYPYYVTYYQDYFEEDIRYSYDFVGIAGSSAGCSLSIPLGSGTKTPKLKIRPEVTYLWGKEPRADRIDFNVFQVGVQLGIAF